MSSIKWNLVPSLAIVASTIVSQSAFATVYFNEQQAAQAIFGNKKITKNFVSVSKEQAKSIEKKSGVNFRNSEIKMWNVEGGGTFIVDEVLGKHEFITYAIGINQDGTVKGIEIMSYNESYGYEIRDEKWREQFVGKGVSANFKLDSDIKNISGATLSCRHVSDGVKRVLTTLEILTQK
jgi:Na+-translocating ferredoxin:NAD+ oxidoreductase RnfG subunit